VFGFGAATRIYLAPGTTDMRKGFNGLYGLVRDRLMCDPLSGHVFLFSNAQRNRLKIIFWDGTGLWVCAKRIEKGRVHWPEVDEVQGKVLLSHEEFAMLLGGIDLSQARQRRWYRSIRRKTSSRSSASTQRPTTWRSSRTIPTMAVVG